MYVKFANFMKYANLLESLNSVLQTKENCEI